MADRFVRLGDAGLLGGRRRDPGATRPARRGLRPGGGGERPGNGTAAPWRQARRPVASARIGEPGGGAARHVAGDLARPMARLRALEERPRVVGPHARLGLAWFLVLMAALAAGRLGLILILAPCAGLAAAQAMRSRRTRPRPSPPAAAAGAALVVVAAGGGPVAVGVAVIVLAGAVVAGVVLGGASKAASTITLVAAVAIGLAGASPVLLLRDGIVPVLVLLIFAAVHDASAYVVGTGAASAWEGPAAGAASIAAVTLGVAAVLVPPFRGATPWILGGVAVVLAPLGPYAASALMGDRRANVPALRRIDSLLVLAPVWCLVAVLVLD